jgi:hypothetical protein
MIGYLIIYAESVQSALSYIIRKMVEYGQVSFPAARVVPAIDPMDGRYYCHYH